MKFFILRQRARQSKQREKRGSTAQNAREERSKKDSTAVDNGCPNRRGTFISHGPSLILQFRCFFHFFQDGEKFIRYYGITFPHRTNRTDRGKHVVEQ